jgi:hypothetical protein
VPFATALATQPVAGLHESVVHGFPSLQTRGAAAVQVPLWQVSAPLQRLVSAHEVPLGTFALAHPVVLLHVSAVQAFPSLQLSAVPAVQVPAWQVSAPLHTFPSEHAVPLATAVFWHPETALHVSVVHGFESLQLSAAPAVQVPDWQVSLPLHTVESAHEEPLGNAGFEQPVLALQLSAVQAFPSLQLSGVPAVQTPDWQVSLPLQRLLSRHDVPLATTAF